jgi:hypothetical protein
VEARFEFGDGLELGRLSHGDLGLVGQAEGFDGIRGVFALEELSASRMLPCSSCGFIQLSKVSPSLLNLNRLSLPRLGKQQLMTIFLLLNCLVSVKTLIQPPNDLMLPPLASNHIFNSPLRLVEALLRLLALAHCDEHRDPSLCFPSSLLV